MFDMAALPKIADALVTGVADVDSRLEAINNKLDLLIVLMAMSTATALQHSSGAEHPIVTADITEVIEIARLYRSIDTPTVTPE